MGTNTTWLTPGVRAVRRYDEPELDVWAGDRCTVTAVDIADRRVWVRMLDGREFVVDDDGVDPEGGRG